MLHQRPPVYLLGVALFEMKAKNVVRGLIPRSFSTLLKNCIYKLCSSEVLGKILVSEKAGEFIYTRDDTAFPQS